MPAFWILTSRPTGASDADMDTVDGAAPPMLVVAPMLAVTTVDRSGRADARRTWSPMFEKSIRSRTGPKLALWILTSRPSREVGACDADMDTAAAGADPPMLVVAPMHAVTAVDRAGSRQCSTDVVADVGEVNPIENGAGAGVLDLDQ
jgi:hypothetical protein